MHLWGKPFFTLVSSPFAQFGIKGAHFFNILCAVGSSYFCYKIAKRLEINNALFVIPFLCFAPIYFSVVQSGLTEPFFGLVLVMGIYNLTPGPSPKGRGENLTLPTFEAGQAGHFPKEKGENLSASHSSDEKESSKPKPDLREGDSLHKPAGSSYLFAAGLISFLPFIRSEGFLILPLFLIILLYRKKFRVIPLLALGTIVYSILGYFHYGDPLWLVHQNPYQGASQIYGSGTLYHFFIRAEFIWGFALFLLFFTGCLWLLKKIISERNINSEASVYQPLPEEFILVYGSFFIYFIAHVIFWWQGLFSSLGLIRVIAAVMPVSAIISLRGYNYILPFFIRFNQGEKLFGMGLFSAILLICLFHNRSIMKLNPEDQVIKQAADWIKAREFKNQKIYYLHPYVSLALETDPFDRNKTGELWGMNHEDPSIDMPAKSMVIWDGHFGPNEGATELNMLMNNPSFTLLNKFVPEKEFTVLGGGKFEVYLFERK